MPTVVKIKCDASEYARELTKAIALAREAAAQIEKLTAGGGKDAKITVTAGAGQVAEAAIAVDELKANDGENVSITIDVKQTGSDLQTVNDKLADVRQKTITIPPSNLFTQLSGTLRGAWRALTDFQGGIKRLTSLIGAGGGAVGVFVAAIASIGKIIGWVCDQIDRAKDASAKLSLTNAQSVREVAEANAEVQQKTDGYMSKLGELASVEKLSNEQKAEAVRLIAALGKNYRDLGVEIDAATGKLTGFDEAMIKKAKQDRERQLREIDAELKDLSANDAKQREELKGSDWVVGERAMRRLEKAQAQLDENAKRRMELMKKRGALRSVAPEAEFRDQRKAQLKDLEKQAADAARERAQGNYDRRYNELSGAGSHAAAAAVKSAQLRQFQNGELFEAESKVLAAEKALEGASSDDAKREAKINLLQVQKELNAAKEKELAIYRQLTDAEQKAADASGHGKEYASQAAIENESRRRGRDLTDDERDSISRLARLEWEMAHDNAREISGRTDLSIKSDALTARGGFKNGAAAPDADKWNRANNELQKKTLTRLNEIAELVKKLMTSVDDAGG